MGGANEIFEVEIRCHFDKPEEVYETLPFVHSCLHGEVEIPWATSFFGLTLFKSGQLLRAGEAVHHGQVIHFLTWKGPDIGSFANIRREISERFTREITNSTILKRLGGAEGTLTPDDLVQELERLGHRQFMAFQGTDLAGYDAHLGVKVKLMFCSAIKWPLILELEKAANTEDEANRCEQALHKLCVQFQLQSRLLQEEPPSLLYEALSDSQAK